MSDEEAKLAEDIWVNTSEAAEITGYTTSGLRQLAAAMFKKPEEERMVNVRKRSSGWELWLPDLIYYVEQPRKGPQLKSRKSESSF